MSVKQFWMKHLHPWVLAIVCWASIVLVAFDVFAPTPWKLGMTHHASWITLILVSLFVLAFLEKEREHPRLLHASRLGIKDIYRSRADQDQIKEYEDLLRNAKRSLFIVGITLKDLSHEQKDHLLRKAEDGCRIELLMLSPQFRDNNSPILDPVAAAAGPDILRLNFSVAIANIRQLAKTIRNQNKAATSSKRGELAVRFYTTAPTVSLTVKDGETAYGRMHVEIIPHQIFQAPFRPIMDIDKVHEEGFFTEFYRRYRDLWNHGTTVTYIEVNANVPGGMRVNHELDCQLSAWLGLPETWQEDRFQTAS